jgi:hypothetical protein
MERPGGAAVQPDDMTLQEVARRLGKTPSWLKSQLSADRGLAVPERRLQCHHYIGRTPLWTEAEYQNLRAALISREPPRGGRRRQPRQDADGPPPASPSSSAMANGGSSAGYTLREASSASGRVQNFLRRPRTERPPRSSGDKRRAPSMPASPGEGVLPYRRRRRP